MKRITFNALFAVLLISLTNIATAQNKSGLTSEDWGSTVADCAATYNIFGKTLEIKGDKKNADFFNKQSMDALDIGFKFIGPQKTYKLFKESNDYMMADPKKYAPQLEAKSIKCFGNIKAAQEELARRN
ncbi:MAG: hypothetical protein ACOVOP_01375 [Candidatus Planktophila sp.]